MAIQSIELIPEIVDLKSEEHQVAFAMLLGVYISDEMGFGKKFKPEKEFFMKVISELSTQSNYLGFIIKSGSRFVALANCFINYSTFRASKYINIHDLVVLPEFRKQGVGEALLKTIENYALKFGYCKINLEVREDNISAQKLYKKTGYADCKPVMFFWEKFL